MKNKLQILSVKIERKLDESPDTSWLGEYSNTPEDHAIDRQERGDQERGTFRYFNPTQHHNIDDWSHVSDVDVLKAYGKEIQAGHQELDREAMIEALNASYREQDYQRMESLNSGQWSFIGIIAKAEVRNPSTDVCQVVRSGGLWGVESDSGNDCLAQVEQEELASLKVELLALSNGPGERAIDYAIKKVVR